MVCWSVQVMKAGQAFLARYGAMDAVARGPDLCCDLCLDIVYSFGSQCLDLQCWRFMFACFGRSWACLASPRTVWVSDTMVCCRSLWLSSS